MPASRAYRAAGFATGSDNSAEVLASRTLRKVQVAARLAELRAEQAKRHEVTIDSLAREFDENRAHALRVTPTRAAACPADRMERSDHSYRGRSPENPASYYGRERATMASDLEVRKSLGLGLIFVATTLQNKNSCFRPLELQCYRYADWPATYYAYVAIVAIRRVQCMEVVNQANMKPLLRV